MTLKQRWKRVSLPNKLLIMVGAFAAFATILSVGLAWFQYRLAVNESKDTARQADRLIAATDKAARELAAANATQINAITKTLEAAREDRELTERLTNRELAESRALQREANSIARETLIWDQRPWLLIESATIELIRDVTNEKIFDYGSFNGKIVFRNWGRTPAVDVRVSVGTRHQRFSGLVVPPPILKFKAPVRFTYPSTMPQTVEGRIEITQINNFDPVAFTDGDLIVSGEIKYRDLAGGDPDYATGFCYQGIAPPGGRIQTDVPKETEQRVDMEITDMRMAPCGKGNYVR